jgi:hypothetical protein
LKQLVERGRIEKRSNLKLVERGRVKRRLKEKEDQAPGNNKMF